MSHLSFPSEYDQLLASGKRELSGDLGRSSTGADYRALFGRYLKEMISLNDYISTSASTNFTYDKYLQAMYITGFIHKSLVTDEFMKFLQSKNYSYVFYSEPDCCGKHGDRGEPKIIHLWYSKDALKRSIVADIFNNRSVYDEDFERLISKGEKKDNKDYSEKLYKLFVKITGISEEEKHKYGIDYDEEYDDNLAKRIAEMNIIDRKKCGDIDFNDIYELAMSNEEFSSHIDELCNDRFISKPSVLNDRVIGLNGSDYCCVVKKLVGEGEVLSFEIENIHDPWNRELYSELLKYFQSLK